MNALCASDSVMITLQTEYFALEGLTQLMKIISLVQENLNTSLELEGVVLTMYDKRTNLANQVASDVREYFKDKVYKTMIPRNIKLGEAPSFGKPINLYDPDGIGAQSYRGLAEEVIAQNVGEKKNETKVLGKGLGNLIGVSGSRNTEAADNTGNSPLKEIKLSEIKLNPNQLRKTFSAESISELSETIKQHGLIQPIVVNRTSDGYELVSGERRYRACKEAGFHKIPAIVRNYSEKKH